jgi:two-component system KDP operon response regulator KdpE
MNAAPAKTTILLVEDDQGLRFLLQLELEAQGFRVMDYGSAEEALAESLDTIDLAVLDYHLPGHTGLQLLQSLRSLRGQVPALVISSEKDLNHHPRWPGRHTALLAKPFGRDSFLSSVNGCLSHNT